MADAGLKMTVILGAQSASTQPKLTAPTIPPTGWTETWWLSDPAFANGLATAQAYVNVRAPLLGLGAFISAVKLTLPGVQLPANKRQSQIFIPAVGVGGASTWSSPNSGNPSIQSDDYDPTQADLMFRVEAGPAKRRVFWMGGLPDSQTDSFSPYGMTAAFLNSSQMKKWQAFVVNSFGVRDIVLPRNPVPSLNTYVFNQVTAALWVQCRNRKRGRPFFLFRGRRKA